MNKSSIQMYPEQHFAVVKFKSGDLYLDELIQINKAYKEHEQYSTIHFLVMIFLECNPIFTEKDLDEIADKYSVNVYPNNHIRSVFLVDSPKTTAFAHLIHSNTPEESFYCSTFEKAYEFLRPNISFTEFLEKTR
ncbi:MAG: hypothetical protein R6U95_01845 [Bacteroidales bacterium]